MEEILFKTATPHRNRIMTLQKMMYVFEPLYGVC